jgi:DNA-binding transcriptional MerR regulator
MLQTLRTANPPATISQASRQCRLTPRAIRLYEDQGLVCARRTLTGARLYGSAEIERLEFIALARRAGLSIADIRLLVETGERDGKAARATAMAELCRARLTMLESQRREIEAIMADLAGPSRARVA